jgi:hypothetical protein
MLVLSAGSEAGAGLYRGALTNPKNALGWKGVDKNLGVQELVNILSSFIPEKYLRSLLWVKDGENRGIWVG